MLATASSRNTGTNGSDEPKYARSHQPTRGRDSLSELSRSTPTRSLYLATLVAVHAENDGRVSKEELLVEKDLRDYKVAVEQARAHAELRL